MWILPNFRNFLCALLALQSAAAAQAQKTPTPTPAELQSLVERLAQSPTKTEQDSAIAATRSIEGKTLREALIDRAYRLTFEGDYARAERLSSVVERLARGASDPADLARAQVRLSDVLREYGEYPQALAQLDAALVYLDKNPDGVTIVGAYQGRGIVYLYEGDFARALANLQRAYSLAEERKFGAGMTAALNSLGEVYREEGLPERALDFYARARTSVADDSAPPLAFIFNNMGQAYEAMGQLDQAAEFIDRARAVAEKTGMRPRVATSLAVLGKIKAAQKKWDEADKFFEQSLILSRELREVFSEGRALLGQASVASARGKPEAALKQADAAAAIFEKIALPDWLAAALTAQGRAFVALHHEAEARASFEKAIAATESLRGNIAGTETEAEAFLESRLTPYRELIELLLKSGQTEKALLLSERASARAILEAINRGGGSASSLVALTPEDEKRARELDHHVADLNRALMKVVGDEGKRATAEAELREAQNARQNFEAELATAHPELKRAQPDPIPTLEPLEKIAAEGKTVLLKFVLGDERSYLFVLRAGSEKESQLEVFPLPIARVELEKIARRFRSRLADRDLLWKEDGRALFEAILRPAEAAWKDARHLVIVPDGGLWEVPFQALLDQDERPLLERVALSYAPSLSTLSRLRDASPPSRRDDLVAFANPARSETPAANDLPPLPEMEGQVRQLEKLYHDHQPKIFVGPEAREEVARREMPAAALLHFATHGILNDRAPLYSNLVLSQRELAAGEDGLLQAWEIMHLRLKTQLAILCGCETARGRVSAGEGMIGFSWAFFVAGCPATIVSQWKVDSASSTPLMLALHKKLLAGKAKADALREAALELRQRPEYQHPFYWAPFVLIGDER